MTTAIWFDSSFHSSSKKRFQTLASSCSDFPSEAMFLINEVEMVDSLDEVKTLRLIKGKDFPKFEMLDARIASALNMIIQNSYFKKKVSLEEQKAQKENRFLRGRQITYMIYTTFESLMFMIPFLISLIYSKSLFVTAMFETSIRQEKKFHYL